MRALDLVEADVVAGGVRLSLLRPRDPDALIDEQAFEHEEYLPYWAELWPSALALADAVAALGVERARVLEVGCGLGVPSLAAARLGAEVTATDWSPEAVELLRRNARRNGVRLEASLARWDEPALAARGPWDVVLAADVLYERRNGDQLLPALRGLAGAAGLVLLADPGRPPAAAFLERAAEGFEVETAVRPLGSSTVRLHRLRPRRAIA